MKRVENMVIKGEMVLVLSNFFFCRHVFKKPSSAEASERVKHLLLVLTLVLLFATLIILELILPHTSVYC